MKKGKKKPLQGVFMSGLSGFSSAVHPLISHVGSGSEFCHYGIAKNKNKNICSPQFQIWNALSNIIH